MSLCGIMALVEFINKNLFIAYVLSFSSVVFAIGYYIQKKYNNMQLSASITLCILYLLMFYLVYSGGIAQSGPLWIYIIAPVSLFIYGLRQGLMNIAFFMAIIALIIFIPSDSPTYLHYPVEFKIRLIISFLAVTFLSGVYEYSREKSYQHTLELGREYQQLAHFDSLTELPNRRYAQNILKQEKARFERNKEPLTIMLCDIDHFKKINDAYGHNVGDFVLVELAKIFIQQIRKQDSVARWGGEEFLFIFPQTSAENARVIAEKIMHKLQSHLIEYEDIAMKVTASMGICEFSGQQSIDEVINSADRFLYQAKESGRNQVCPKL